MGLYNANIMSRKSAYQYAVEGGYEGTEEEFAKLLGNIDNVLNDFYTSEQVDNLLDDKLNKDAIDDENSSYDTLYSSAKIEDIIDDFGKILNNSLDDFYTSEQVDALLNDKLNTSVLDDTSASSTTIYSSSKVESLIAESIEDFSTLNIDDENISTDTVYSSSKVEELITDSIDNIESVEINDDEASTTTVYSSSKVEKLFTDNNTLGEQLSTHVSNVNNPHNVTAVQIGLENVDNTSDLNKPVSTAQQNAIDSVLSTAKSYTDTKIADLVGTAPETLNTLEEVAKSIEENEDIVEALNGAIGTKANQSDLNDLETEINEKMDSLLNDEVSSTTSTYSSDKIDELLSETSGIDDNNSSTTSTYSSNKINSLLTAVEGKMLTVQTSTTDLTAGTSTLASGTIYCVYE